MQQVKIYKCANGYIVITDFISDNAITSVDKQYVFETFTEMVRFLEEKFDVAGLLSKEQDV